MGKSVTVIHTADLHLLMKPEKDLPIGRARAAEVEETLPRLIEVCNRENADLLLIAGDLFHCAPRVSDLREAAHQFAKLTKTRVVLIAGNHDHISASSNYPAFAEKEGWLPGSPAWDGRVTMLIGETIGTVTWDDLPVTVYGLSYHKRDVTAGVYDGVVPSGSGIHILLAHGGDAKNAPLNIARIAANGWDYVALGHIHKPGTPAPGIAYAGSPEPLDRNETGPHGYRKVVFTEDGVGRYEMSEEFVPMAVREYRDLEIPVTPESTNGSLRDAVSAAIREGGVQHMYRIFLRGRRDAELAVDIDGLAALGNVTEVDDETLPEYDAEALMREHADDLIGQFVASLYEEAGQDSIAEKALCYGLAAFKV